MICRYTEISRGSNLCVGTSKKMSCEYRSYRNIRNMKDIKGNGIWYFVFGVNTSYEPILTRFNGFTNINVLCLLIALVICNKKHTCNGFAIIGTAPGIFQRVRDSMLTLRRTPLCYPSSNLTITSVSNSQCHAANYC